MSLLVAGAGGFLMGILVFLIIPFIGAGVGWRGPSKLMLILATMPIKRLSIVVSEHNDLVVKPMSFDALGVERITLDGEEKSFEDPAGALSSWLGLPFAFADEETGTLFDPRHAALGMRKRVYDERNEASFHATNGEYAAEGIERWVPGAFTLPDAFQLVDLSAASELVDGGERSEYPKRVKELYKHSRDPFSGGVPLLRLFLPVIAFLATFCGIWFMASQFGTPGGGGGGSVVSFGGSMLVAIATSRQVSVMGLFGSGEDADPDPLAEPGEDRPAAGGSDGDDGPGFWDRYGGAIKKVLGVLLTALLAVGAFVGMLFAWGLFLAIIGTVAFVAGLLFLPLVAQLGRISTTAGDFFASIFFKLGFASYRQPVLTWTHEGYELREYDALPDVAPEPQWYSLFGSQFGVSFVPGPESFGEAGVSVDTLEAHVDDLVTDGGEVESNVPPVRYDKAPALGPDGMGGFVPADRRGYGVLTDIALGWWSDSADGTKSMRELLQAKEEFGGDAPAVGDKTLAYLTAAMGGLGAVLGLVIFVL